MKTNLEKWNYWLDLIKKKEQEFINKVVKEIPITVYEVTLKGEIKEDDKQSNPNVFMVDFYLIKHLGQLFFSYFLEFSFYFLFTINPKFCFILFLLYFIISFLKVLE